MKKHHCVSLSVFSYCSTLILHLLYIEVKVPDFFTNHTILGNF